MFGSVRKQQDADRLTAAFGDDVRPLIMDVTDEIAVAAAAKKACQSVLHFLVQLFCCRYCGFESALQTCQLPA